MTYHLQEKFSCSIHNNILKINQKICRKKTDKNKILSKLNKNKKINRNGF